MQIYSVGEDELNSEYDLGHLPKNTEWAVYSYRASDYGGDGIIVTKVDSKFYMCGLGHCSCYGPMEDFGLEGDGTLENVLADLEGSPDDYDYGHTSAVQAKVLELTSAE